MQFCKPQKRYFGIAPKMGKNTAFQIKITAFKENNYRFCWKNTDIQSDILYT